MHFSAMEAWAAQEVVLQRIEAGPDCRKYQYISYTETEVSDEKS